MHFVHALESDDLALRVNLMELTQRDEKGSSIGMNLNFSGLLLPEGNEMNQNKLLLAILTASGLFFGDFGPTKSHRSTIR